MQSVLLKIENKEDFMDACRRCLDKGDDDMRNRLFIHGSLNNIVDGDILHDLMGIDFDEWKEVVFET